MLPLGRTPAVTQGGPCKAQAAADSPDSKRLCQGQRELEKNMWHSVHVSIHKPTHSPRQRQRFQTKESSGMHSNDSESAWLTLRQTPSIRGLRILADLVVHIFNELVVRRNLDQARQPSARSVSLNDKAIKAAQVAELYTSELIVRSAMVDARNSQDTHLHMTYLPTASCYYREA